MTALQTETGGTVQTILNGIGAVFSAVCGYFHRVHLNLVNVVANYPGYIARLLELLVLFAIAALIWKKLNIGGTRFGIFLNGLPRKKGFWIGVLVVIVVLVIVLV